MPPPNFTDQIADLWVKAGAATGTTRKIFGSVVATRHGLFAARDYVGHGSVVVTEKHYTALLEKPVVDLMSDTSAA